MSPIELGHVLDTRFGRSTQLYVLLLTSVFRGVQQYDFHACQRIILTINISNDIRKNYKKLIL